MLKRLAFALLLAGPIAARADLVDRIFDLTDAHYRANGIDPTRIGGRPQAGANAVVDLPNLPSQRPLRVLRTFIGYGASGRPVFFAVNGGGGAELFTNDAAGRQARAVADAYVEYIFPQRGTNPVGIPNARQSFLHGNDNGYDSHDPLGLWLHVWVNFTDAAFSTKDGQKALADLQKKNGTALDGTPMIKSVSEIDDLYKKGLVTKTTTQDATRYAICPEIRDPRHGGIAPDDFAVLVLRKADGSLLEPDLVAAFNSLKTTGEWNGKP